MDKDDEIKRDLGRLDRALDRIESILAARAPAESDPTFVQALDGAQLKAIDRIVPLLERRAKLLGLDAKDDATSGTGESTVERMTRQIRERSSS